MWLHAPDIVSPRLFFFYASTETMPFRSLSNWFPVRSVSSMAWRHLKLVYWVFTSVLI